MKETIISSFSYGLKSKTLNNEFIKNQLINSYFGIKIMTKGCSDFYLAWRKLSK